MAYCAYQDRCHQEVEQKLKDLGIYGDDVGDIIVDLIQDNFLNEERFAKSYAGGKFRVKKWGRTRIINELKRRKISAYCIKKAMAELEEEDYEGTLRELILKKNKLVKETNLYKRKTKLGQYAIRKGWESYIVWELLKTLEKEGILKK